MSPLKASEAQLFYANLLSRLTLIGFALLVASFVIYMSGVLGSYVPMKEIIQLWTKSSHHYMQTADLQPGWAWLSKVGYGDFLVYIPIIILAGITIVCYIGVIFKFLKTKEYILVVIASVEVLVLLAAASGILQVHGH
jgi:hypothetical protein